jgi:hypothetical protein
VAEVIAAVLEHPEAHVGRVIGLTGPKSEDMRAVAAEYPDALGRTITYVDVPTAEWRERELPAHGLPEHVASHIKTMAQLNADNRYDRLTNDFVGVSSPGSTITGCMSRPMSCRRSAFSATSRNPPSLIFGSRYLIERLNRFVTLRSR